jgi:hypothetical protein
MMVSLVCSDLCTSLPLVPAVVVTLVEFVGG